MACEIASSPFTPASVEHDGFDALIEFNATFDQHTTGGGTINPQLLSNPPTPSDTFGCSPSDGNGPNQTLTTQPTHEPTDSHPTTPAPSLAATPTPYFVQSIEGGSYSPIPIQTSSLRHEFRRSVSEPPNARHQRIVQSGPQVTFTRDGTPLSEEHSTGPIRAQPRKRGQARQQPYQCKSDRQQQAQQQQRYHLRRAQTQPVRPPTSVPVGVPFVPPHPHPMAHMMRQPNVGFQQLSPVMEGQGYISSRVCTPTPEPRPQFMASPRQVIDPRLMGTPPSMSSALLTKQGKDAVVALSVDELRAMIFEAVQKAVRGLESAKANDNTEQTPVSLAGEGGDASAPIEVSNEMTIEHPVEQPIEKSSEQSVEQSVEQCETDQEVQKVEGDGSDQHTLVS